MKSHHSERGFRLSHGGAALALALAAAVAAADERDARACVRIESADERLACYDAAYGFPTESAAERSSVDANAAATGASAAAAAVAPQQAPDDADFGLSKSKAETEGEFLRIEISGISKDAYKRLVFELENGQIWRQIEYKRFSVDEGDVAVIRHGSFGSYKLYVDGTKRWTRVRRVE